MRQIFFLILFLAVFASFPVAVFAREDGSGVGNCIDADSCPKGYQCVRVSGYGNKCENPHGAPGCAQYDMKCGEGEICLRDKAPSDRSSSYCVTNPVDDPRLLKKEEAKAESNVILFHEGKKCVEQSEGMYHMEVEKLPAGFNIDELVSWSSDKTNVGEEVMPGDGIDIPDGTTIKIPETANRDDIRIAIVGTNGVTYYLGGGMVFTIGCKSGEAAMVEGGIVQTIADLAGGKGFEVETKTVILGVKGTEFIVDATDSANTKVYLINGELEVTPKNIVLKPFVLGEGSKVEVSLEEIKPVQSLDEADRRLFVIEDLNEGDEAVGPVKSWPYILVVAVILIGSFVVSRRK